MKQKPYGFYEAAALPPRSEAHVFHFSCCEATLHSRRLLHELLRNSLNAPSVRFIATKNESSPIGLLSFLVERLGLEPKTFRTSSGCSAS